jgi:magnesium chelatase family protein
VAARERQHERGQMCPNAGLGSEAAREAADLGPGARGLLASAIDRLALSARGHDRLLRVARTIADLDGAEGVTETHLGEALGYRERPAA